MFVMNHEYFNGPITIYCLFNDIKSCVSFKSYAKNYIMQNNMHCIWEMFSTYQLFLKTIKNALYFIMI